MASIGDVWLRVLADLTGFEAEVTKGATAAGDKAGAAMSKSLSRQLAAGAGKVVLGGIATAAGIATKGMLELERITADYRAETGATAEEAARAGKAINAMAGRNIQPMEEVGRALTKVRVDMGLSGDAGEKLTEQFLKFAHVTKMDAAEAVVGFDDILDNWGLTADHAGEVMDKLIVSHQKYGGSIQDNIGILAKLAPALRAANFDIDKGIELLGLFGSKGLDADQATAAFAKSLTKVKSPAELQKLITDISNTKDPFERAAKAADLFGARAGAKLANALGGANLDDYKISMDEAAGATEHAADVIDSTFGNRIKLALKGASAALIDFGSSFGPALTGLASLGSLAGALGGGKLLAAIGPPVQKLGLGLAKKLGLALAGNAAIAAIAEGMVAAVTGASASTAVEGAAKTAGTRLGTILGLAMEIAIPVAIVAALAQISDAQFQKQTDDLAATVQRVITEGTLQGMEAAKAEIQEKLRLAKANYLSPAFIEALQGQLDDIDTALRDYKQAGSDVVTNFADGIAENAAKVQKALDAITPTSKTMSAHAQGGFRGGQLYMDAFYRGVVSKQGIVQAALAAATELSKTTMDKAQETEYLLGVLTQQSLVKGVNDKRDNVRVAYQETVRLAIARLEKLAPEAGNLSKKAMNELIKATKSKIPEVARAAQQIVDRIEGKIKSTDTKTPTKRKVSDIADELYRGKGKIGRAAAELARTIYLRMLAQTQALGGQSTGSPYHKQQFGGPTPAHVPVLVGERGRELWIPQSYGHTIPHAQTETLLAQPSAGGDTYNVNLLDRFPATSVRDIGAGLSMLGRQGYLSPPKKAWSW